MSISTLKHTARVVGRLFWRAGAATVVAVSFSGMMPVVASADTDYHDLPVGTVTQQEPMTLPSAMQSIATGVRVWYVSTDTHGEKFLVTGAIITPNDRPSHPKIVAWAHGTTGTDDHCAPSANLDVFWPEAVAAVSSYLEHGWVVAATDYQGLGGTGDHEYIVGDSEGRAVIDSVRAARNLDNHLSDQWVVSGHSEGAQAALFTGQIADTYGQGLSLKAAIAISPVSNFEAIVPGILGSPLQGYDAFILSGLHAFDPSVDVSSILGQQGNNLYPTLQTGCWEEVLGAYAGLNANQMIHSGQFPGSVITEIASYADPAQEASTIPVFLVNGTQDVPLIFFTGDLQSQVCAYGTSTEQEFVDADHDNTPIASTGIVGDYITARFAGQTAPSNCQ